MILRLTVLLLVLANAAYFAWSQGLLFTWGMGPLQQSEPQRLGQQIRPEAMRIVSAAEARRFETAVVPSPQPSECLQAGPLEERRMDALRLALQAFPAGSWTLEVVVEPPRWIVYLGKYPTVEILNRKKAELRQLGISFESPSNQALEGGLSLGGFSSQAAANEQLDRLTDRGLRSGRVVQERPEMRGQVLKLPAVDETVRPRLDELRPALSGKTLRPCR